MKVKARTTEPKLVEEKDAKTGEVKQVSKKVTKQEVECEVNIPSDFAGLVSAFGEELVAKAAEDAIIISAQAQMRRMLDAEKSDADIQTHMNSWKPDTKNVTRQSAFEKAASSIGKLTPQERAELLAKLQAAE